MGRGSGRIASVPGLGFNLVSVPSLASQGQDIRFESSVCRYGISEGLMCPQTGIPRCE